MKKKIITFCLTTLTALFLTGCGETITNNYGQEVYIFGPYIQISKDNGKMPNNEKVYFYTVYHRKTKEMFEFIYNYSDGSCSIRQIWDYDEEGYPIVKYYEGEYVE